MCLKITICYSLYWVINIISIKYKIYQANHKFVLFCEDLQNFFSFDFAKVNLFSNNNKKAINPLFQYGRLNSVFTRNFTAQEEIQGLHLPRWGPQCGGHGASWAGSGGLLRHWPQRHRHYDGHIHKKLRLGRRIHRGFKGKLLLHALLGVKHV